MKPLKSLANVALCQSENTQVLPPQPITASSSRNAAPSWPRVGALRFMSNTMAHSEKRAPRSRPLGIRERRSS